MASPFFAMSLASQFTVPALWVFEPLMAMGLCGRVLALHYGVQDKVSMSFPFCLNDPSPLLADAKARVSCCLQFLRLPVRRRPGHVCSPGDPSHAPRDAPLPCGKAGREQHPNGSTVPRSRSTSFQHLNVDATLQSWCALFQYPYGNIVPQSRSTSFQHPNGGTIVTHEE